MNELDQAEVRSRPAQRSRPAHWTNWRPPETRLAAALGALAVLVLGFSGSLFSLFHYAAGSEVHSHILLVPFISAYLLYIERRQFPANYTSSPLVSLGLALGALVSIGLATGPLDFFERLSRNDHLSLLAFAFVCLVASVGFLFLGKKWMAAAAFPIGFLLFMVPLPDAVIDSLETASKYASAEAASWLFNITGTPNLREGVFFQLPGIVIEVAQECSGIRSSLVLVITSLLASHLFLESPWRKFLLVAFVIPLGVIRNGFRILVIGWLCIHFGPHMIHSVIHKRGGPLFFALSLVPLFLFLWWLRKGEQGRLGRSSGAARVASGDSSLPEG